MVVTLVIVTPFTVVRVFCKTLSSSSLPILEVTSTGATVAGVAFVITIVAFMISSKANFAVSNDL